MKTLTQAKRDQVRERARSSIRRRIGPAPTLDQFRRHTTGRYPDDVKRWVYAMMIVPLVAFLTLSAMNLYSVGEKTHGGAGHVLGLVPKNLLSGLDVVLGAEFTQIVLVIALQVLATGHRKAQAAFGVGIVLSTAIALVGNGQQGLTDDISPFKVLITLAPPVIVLFLGEVLALLWLDTLAASHEAQRRYEEALNQWSLLSRELEQHPEWPRVYATALRDELCRINNMTVDDLPVEEWLVLVNAEMSAENWYSSVEFRRNPVEPQKRSESKLIDSVEGDGTQVEKVLVLFDSHPELLEMGRKEAMNRIGVGGSSFYEALNRYEKNGHGNMNSVDSV